jgi:hypothetical protein
MPSTVIAGFSYDAAAEALTVTFTTGRVYRYRDVPPDVAAAFRLAFSKGRFFNLRIRDRYSFDEVTPGPA